MRRKIKKELNDKEIFAIKGYYDVKMKEYPDVLKSKDIQIITGYSKEIIRQWIHSEKITGIIVKKRFIVAKEDLRDFLLSPYYSNIIRKSKVHISDFKKIGMI